MMITAAGMILICAAIIAIAFAVGRVIKGPTDVERIVALDLLFAAAIALCLASALLTNDTVFLDVALGLALVGFISTMGWARLVNPNTTNEAIEEQE